MARTKYSQAEKHRICADFALLGDADAVSEKHGVKLSTLNHWRKQPWFRDLMDRLQSQNSRALVGRANNVMLAALEELEDRVRNGDVRVAMVKGEPVQYREPVKARDLSSVVNVLATRSEKAAALNVKQVENLQLADLSDMFRDFAKQTKEHNTINGEYSLITDQSGNTKQ